MSTINLQKSKMFPTNIALVFVAMLLCLLVGNTACFAETVLLSWDANTEPTLAGYKVYYKADSSALPFDGTGAAEGASPVNVHNQTTASISGLDPNRAYYFAITAYDVSGLESPYSSIVTVLETVSPTVAISSPVNGSTVSGVVTVTAGATDNVGVTKVEFYVNDVLKSTDTATPYVYSWDTTSLASGTYTLMVKAYDAAGNIGQSSVTSVTVVNDITAPVVSLTNPGSNSTVSGTVTITASAADNVGVSKVEFYISSVLVSAGNVAPYSYSWNTSVVANGSYILSARAYDNAGNSLQSADIPVTVANDTVAPTVSIGVRKAVAMPNGTLSISAVASDNVGVSRVEFYVNGTLASTATMAPYVFNWDSTALAGGSYSLMARAYDVAGNSAQTANVKLFLPNCQFR